MHPSASSKKHARSLQLQRSEFMSVHINRQDTEHGISLQSVCSYSVTRLLTCYVYIIVILKLCILFLEQPKKVKNVSFDPFGSKLGRVHMQRQDLSQLQTRKMKGLKRTKTQATRDKGRPSGTKKLKLDRHS